MSGSEITDGKREDDDLSTQEIGDLLASGFENTMAAIAVITEVAKTAKTLHDKERPE